MVVDFTEKAAIWYCLQLCKLPISTAYPLVVNQRPRERFFGVVRKNSARSGRTGCAFCVLGRHALVTVLLPSSLWHTLSG
jgi:hypothetical protein